MRYVVNKVLRMVSVLRRLCPDVLSLLRRLQISAAVFRACSFCLLLISAVSWRVIRDSLMLCWRCVFLSLEQNDFFISECWLENLKALTKDLVVRLQWSQLPFWANAEKTPQACAWSKPAWDIFMTNMWSFLFRHGKSVQGFHRDRPAAQTARCTCWSLLQL